MPAVKVFLIVIYAAFLPPENGERIQFKAHPMGSMDECKAMEKRQMGAVKAGKVLAFCWTLKE